MNLLKRSLLVLLICGLSVVNAQNKKPVKGKENKSKVNKQQDKANDDDDDGEGEGAVKSISCQDITNPELLKLYEEGTNRRLKKEERLAALKKAMELDPDYVDANFAFAEERIKTLIYENAAFKPAVPYYKKVIDKCPDYHSNPYYYIAFSFYEEEKWDSSMIYMKKFLDFKSDNKKRFDKNYNALFLQGRKMLKYATLYDELDNKPIAFDPKPVEAICTDKDEYFPFLTADDELMLFVRKQPYVSKNLVWASDKEVEWFSSAKKIKGTENTFEKGKRMPDPFNTFAGLQEVCMTIDNKRMYLTICKDEMNGTNCDIYSSDYRDGEWSEPQKLEFVNDAKAYDGQPSISADGKTLYFASDRTGGRGKTDIYQAVKDDATSAWGNPENVGPMINTKFDEKNPFIHPDNETFYFSSDGHVNIAGFDYFISRKDSVGKWAKPKNMGKPLNTDTDDLGLFVSADGNFGYITSNQPSRTGGKSVGRNDIFSFELYQEARPDAIAFFKGKIIDKSGEPVMGCTIQSKDAVVKKMSTGMIDSTGNFALIANNKLRGDVLISVKKQGYTFNSMLIVSDSIKDSKPMNVVPIEINPIQTGKEFPLGGIHFLRNSSEVDVSSLFVLSEFATFLRQNESMKVNINVYTDNSNGAQSMKLSNDRANVIKSELKTLGIDEKQIGICKGFGAAKPVADNSTPAGRTKNNRVTYVIVSK